MRQIKLLLILGLVLFVGFFIILSRLFFGGGGTPLPVNVEPTIPPNADIYPKEATLFPTPTNIIVGSTGDSGEALPVNEHLEIKQIEKLREQSPYQGEGFVVVFDYNDGLFAVSGVSESEFFNWLAGSEYNQIGNKWFKFQ